MSDGLYYIYDSNPSTAEDGGMQYAYPSKFGSSLQWEHKPDTGRGWFTHKAAEDTLRKYIVDYWYMPVDRQTAAHFCVRQHGVNYDQQQEKPVGKFYIYDSNPNREPGVDLCYGYPNKGSDLFRWEAEQEPGVGWNTFEAAYEALDRTIRTFWDGPGDDSVTRHFGIRQEGANYDQKPVQQYVVCAPVDMNTFDSQEEAIKYGKENFTKFILVPKESVRTFREQTKTVTEWDEE